MSKSTTEKAFKRAMAGYELFGKKLFAFSAMRQGVAASMGLRFGLVDQHDIFTITVEDVKEKKKKGGQELQFYNQLFSDVIKVLWLCTVTDSRVLRAERRIDEAKIDAFAWADSHGISVTSGMYYSCAAVFLQIMGDISVAEGTPVIPGNQSDDYDPHD